MTGQRPPTQRVSIEFWVPGDFRTHAVGLARELLDGWAHMLRELVLLPKSGDSRRFDATLDDVIFSKAAVGQPADPGEIAAAVTGGLGQAAVVG